MKRRLDGIRAHLLLAALVTLAAVFATVEIVAGRFDAETLQGARWGAAVSAALLVVVTAFVLDAMVLRRLRTLGRAAARMRAGDGAPGLGSPRGRGELAQLERDFDELADRLQMRGWERLQVAERLRLAHARTGAVLEASQDAVLLFDRAGRVTGTNGAARALFGLRERDRALPRLSELFARELPLDLGRCNRATEVFEAMGRRPNGREFPVEVCVAPLRDRAAFGLFAATVRDAAPRRPLAHALPGVAFEDPLTRTYNPLGFLMMGTQQLKIAARNGQAVMVIAVDVDGADRIGTEFGDANRDRAIVEMAAALRASFRDTDAIGRLGEDAFVVLATETAPQGAEHALERLAMRLSSRNAENDLPWVLAGNLGWLRAEPAGELGLVELLERLDAHMVAQPRRTPGPVTRRAASLEPQQ